MLEFGLEKSRVGTEEDCTSKEVLFENEFSSLRTSSTSEILYRERRVHVRISCTSS